MTTDHHKPPANDHQPPPTTSKRPQTTINYQKTNTNSHPCTSNQKSDVSFLPAPDNYKNHTNFEKHTLNINKNYFFSCFKHTIMNSTTKVLTSVIKIVCTVL